MGKCMACLEQFKDYEELASHFIETAENNDSEHIKMLNTYISKEKLEIDELTKEFENFFALSDESLPLWIKHRFVEKFYSDPPHPFIQELQIPDPSTLLGYVFEHQHFLKQWVKSCAYIIAKTDDVAVTKYEIENIMTEFGGIPDFNIDPHYEYLLQMGESLGVSREEILDSPPLPDTKKALEFWHKQAKNGHWLETMVAMHSLELVAYRDITDYGASMTYFDPQILESDEYTDATKEFLREGYEADVDHADEALELAEKHANLLGMIQEVQATFLKSIEMFDIYLSARLTRGKDFE